MGTSELLPLAFSVAGFRPHRTFGPQHAGRELFALDVVLSKPGALSDSDLSLSVAGRLVE